MQATGAAVDTSSLSRVSICRDLYARVRAGSAEGNRRSHRMLGAGSAPSTTCGYRWPVAAGRSSATTAVRSPSPPSPPWPSLSPASGDCAGGTSETLSGQPADPLRHTAPASTTTEHSRARRPGRPATPPAMSAVRPTGGTDGAMDRFPYIGSDRHRPRPGPQVERCSVSAELKSAEGGHSTPPGPTVAIRGGRPQAEGVSC